MKLKFWKKKPNHRYNLVYLIESTPYSKSVYPVQFIIEQTDDIVEMSRIAKSWWFTHLKGGKDPGFYCCASVEFVKKIEEDLTGQILEPDKTYEMGRYVNKCKYFPVTMLDLVD